MNPLIVCSENHSGISGKSGSFYEDHKKKQKKQPVTANISYQTMFLNMVDWVDRETNHQRSVCTVISNLCRFDWMTAKLADIQSCIVF